MKLRYLLSLGMSLFIFAGCTSMASKDDVYLLKSSVNEEIAQLKTDIQRLQEQVQEISQTVDFVEKDTTNQILSLTTEIYDRVSALENNMVQDKAAIAQKMDILVNEVARVDTRQPTKTITPSVQTRQYVPAIPENAISYTVKTGDTLSKIARAHGISKEELAAVNGIEDEDYLAIGDVLLIPQE